MATPDAFRRNPVLVHQFYNDRRRGHAGVRPNAAHMLISIGTSGNVYPRRRFRRRHARGRSARTVELNLEPSEGAHLFHEAMHGPATQIVPAYVDRLLTAT